MNSKNVIDNILGNKKRILKQKQKISQDEWDNIFKKQYISWKGSMESLINWMNKKFEIKD